MTVRVAVVVNPTKIVLDDVRGVLHEEAAAAGVDDLRLLETTEDDPGSGQTREAVEAGADLVCALGGDGTVRAVAQALVGVDAALGLLPGGTGNLLARNVGVPVDDLREAFRVTLSGQGRAVDVGWLVVEPTRAQLEQSPPDPADNVHCFVVMAGLGFDAAMMDDASEELKDKAGWAAYVASAGRHLGDDGFRLTLGLDGGTTTYEAARTVVVGNCGELQAGMVLLPDAQIDDGLLDLAVLTPQGVGGWLAVAARVLTRSGDGPSVQRQRGRDVTLQVVPAQPCEVDGDILGTATSVRLVVQPGCLVVRVPAS